MIDGHLQCSKASRALAKGMVGLLTPYLEIPAPGRLVLEYFVISGVHNVEEKYETQRAQNRQAGTLSARV